jgi:hypothetical protein
MVALQGPSRILKLQKARRSFGTKASRARIEVVLLLGLENTSDTEVSFIEVIGLHSSNFFFAGGK